MNSQDLTREQAAELDRQLTPVVRYLHRLRNRTDERAFPEDDELRQLVETAYSAVHRLSGRLHYLSCDGGVGRPARE